MGFEVLAGESDSGFLSYQLGDFAATAEQAKNVAAQLNRSQARKLVVLSASAYRMFTTRYSRFGAALPEGMKIFHATEFLSDLFDLGKLVPKKKLRERITYHDPCCLSRFTYVIDPPRKILAAIANSPIVEMDWSGKTARSCGGCGGVPFTYPEISEKASQVRVQEALKTGAQILASADPECEEMLSRAANDIAVKDIVELVAEAI
jgi:Fe-S oxidoreductase